MGLITNKFVKGTLIALSYLLAGIATAQDQTQKFDFKGAAGPAKAVFAELSKAAGVDLVASSSVANDVVFLQFKGVTVAEAMEKIAKTLHGEWRKEGLGSVFYRGPNYEAADQRAETAAKVAAIRAQINKMVSDQKTDGPFDAKAAQKIVDANKEMMKNVERSAGTGGPIRIGGGDFASMARRAPGARAIAAMLSRMSDAQLALIASGKRVVFGSRPTRMQVGMPNGSDQILNNFVREQLILQNAQKQGEGPVNESRSIMINGFGGDGMGDGDPRLGVGYAILVAQSFGTGSNANLTLTVADPNGKTLSGGNLFLGGQQQQEKAPEAMAIPGEKPIQVSELSKELGKVLNQGNGTGSGRVAVFRVAVGNSGGSAITINGQEEPTPVLTDALKNYILHPEQYDPMALAPGEAFSSVAEQAGKNMVAYLPDSTFTSLTRLATSGSPLPSNFLSNAQVNANLQVVDDNGWLLISPKAPAAARERRTNRIALGNALRTLDQKGNLNLDELAAFSLAQPKAPQNEDIDELYFRLINTPFAQSTITQYAWGGTWQMLQLYGSMSVGQRQSMVNTGQIALSSLSNQQLSNLSDQVFNSPDGPQVELPPEPGDRQTSRRVMAFAGGGGGIMTMGGNSVLTERTVVLPNGIVREGYLTIKLENNEGVHGKTGNSAGSKFMSADTLAFDRLSQERADMQIFGATTHPDHFRIASQKQYTFQFVFTPQVSLSRTLQDDQPSNRPFVPFEQLPESFRKQVEQKLQSLRQGFGKGFGGGSGTPPPAP